jgi:DnaJ-class molecular chaperone
MDLYKILDVNKNSSSDDIRKAFRKLSLKHHPDRGGDEEEFKKLNRAFEILGDSQKKREYDMKQNSPFKSANTNIFSDDGSGGMGGMGGMPDLFKMFFNGAPMEFENMHNMHNMHNMAGGPNIRIFRNGRPVYQNNNVKPPPITKTLIINLDEAYDGVVKPLEIEKWIIHDNIKKMEKETLYIEIPTGIDNNEIIIMKNKGNINTHGIQGDIKIQIKIKNNSMFIRQGLDLLIKKKVSLKEALIGLKFQIKHLNKKSYMINNFNNNVITPDFKSVIAKMGMKRGNNIGRMIILFEVEFPKTLSEEQKEQLKNIL